MDPGNRAGKTFGGGGRRWIGTGTMEVKGGKGSYLTLYTIKRFFKKSQDFQRLKLQIKSQAGRGTALPAKAKLELPGEAGNTGDPRS